MNLQPTLEGQILILRPLKESDFEELYLAASDPKTWEQHPHSNRYQRPIFEGYFKSGMESGGALVAIEKKSGKIIGCSRYYELNEPNSVAIGYTFLHHNYWGGLYNKEFKALMLDHAFKSVKDVHFHIHVNNLRSQKGTEKIGAVRVAELPNWGGVQPPSPHYLYKISRPQS